MSDEYDGLGRDFLYAMKLQEEIEVQAKGDGYLMISHPQCGWWCVPPSPSRFRYLQDLIVNHLQLHLKHLREGDQ